MKITRLLLFLFVAFFLSCKKKSDTLPTVTTFPISKITDQGAESGGFITGENISEKGVCWGTTPNPAITGLHSEDGSGSEHFESKISGLTALKLYYVRAYAKNSAGVAYGAQMSFNTTKALVLPTIKTVSLRSVSQTSAVSGVSLQVAGDVALTSYGVCWNTSPNPTTANFKSADQTIPVLYQGTFVLINIGGLMVNTQYYVRAYAQVGTQTIYGDEINFTTFATAIQDYDGNTYNSIKIGGKEWMTENLRVTHYRNGDLIPNITLNSQWAQINYGAYSVYNNSGSAPFYGNLYNFHAVYDTRQIAPAGWHVATEAEWAALISALGGETSAGNKIRSAEPGHWPANTQTTNETGFSALAGGYRSNDGYYALLTQSAWFWTATASTTDPYAGVGYYLDNYNLNINSTNKLFGCSVRCVKD